MKHFYLVVAFFCFAFSYGQRMPSGGEIEGLKLYPNPVTEGKVYIDTNENAPKQVSIYDVLGTQVLQSQVSGNELMLADLDAGVYVLRVYQNNKMATRKLIIK